MKMPKTKIEACAGKNDIRAPLNAVHFEIDDDGARLVATDGTVLACVPVEAEEDDAPGYVTTEALAMARKVAGRNDAPLLACNGVLALPNGATFPRPDDNDLGAYPDWRRAVPDVDAERAPDLVVDVDLLMRAAKALIETGGGAVLRLYLSRNAEGEICPDGPVLVKPRTDRGYGVVMPCRR